MKKKIFFRVKIVFAILFSLVLMGTGVSSSFGAFNVQTASRASGSAASADQQDIPGSVESLERVASDQSSVSLQWSPPANADEVEIENYQVQYWKEAAPEERTTLTTTDTRFETSSLDANSSYRFEVSAINAAGIGAPQQISFKTLLDAPQNLEQIAATPNSITISWTAPIDERGVEGYKIEYWKEGGHVSISDLQGLTATTITFDGLIPDSRYSFRVSARSDVGYGAWNELLVVQTPPLIVDTPVYVGNLNAVVDDQNTANLQWSPPTSVADGEIQNYQVEYWKEAAPEERMTVTTTDTRFVSPRLDPNTLYIFTVLAVDAAGVGRYSWHTSFVTRLAAPQNLELTASTSDSITISWTAPDDSRGVGGYSIDYWERDGVRSRVLIEDSVTTTKTIVGLFSGSSYSFRIFAWKHQRNVRGFGLQSEILIAETQPVPPEQLSLPGSVSDLNATVDDQNSVSLQWSPPINADELWISNYQIRYWKDDAPEEQTTITTTDTHLVTPPLEANTIYHFEVSAINATGRGGSSSRLLMTRLESPTLEQTAATPYSITISWTAPIDERGVEEYIIEYWKTGAAESDVTVQESTETTITLNGLVPDSRYSFRVSGRTDLGGYGLQSEILIAETSRTTPFGQIETPGRVESLTATVDDQNSVSLQWSPPTNVADAEIESYQVQYWKEGASEERSTATPTDTRFMTLPLEANTIYHFEVSAVNAVSTGDPQRLGLKTRLAAPQNLEQTAATSNSITISWTAPDDGLEVEEYMIEYWRRDDIPVIESHESIETTITIDGLVSDSSYSFRVSARNDIGSGLQSEILIAETPPILVEVPVQVENLTLTTDDQNSAILEWAPPTNAAELEIQWYQIRYWKEGVNEEERTKAKTIDTRFETPSLETNSFYNFEVTAVTAAGSGAPRQISLKTRLAAPENLEQTAATLDSITISWTAPDDGRGVEEYMIEYRRAESGELLFVLQEPTTTTLTIDGLIPGRRYSFRVSARSDIGYGASSEMLTVYTAGPDPDQLDIPTHVENLSVTVSSRNTARLQWSPPADAAELWILNYQIRYWKEGASEEERTTETTTDTRFETIRLEANTNYYFEVSAVNAAGVGYSWQTSLKTLLDAPENLEQTASTPESITISWTAPDDGRGVEEYSIEYWRTGSDDSFVVLQEPTTTTLTIDGLVPESRYSFRVSAWSDIGHGIQTEILTAETALVPEPGLPLAAGISSLSITATSLELKWLPPAEEEGSEIIGYKIQYWTGSRDSEEEEVIERETEIEYESGSDRVFAHFYNLEPETIYYFRVAAKNQKGRYGEWGEAFKATTLSLPERVENLESVLQTSRSVYLRWSAPSANDAQLEGYEITYWKTSSPESSWSLFVSSETLSTRIINLEKNAEYVFEIRALNSFWEPGDTSEQILVTTAWSVPTEATSSEVETNAFDESFYITLRGRRSIKVRWETPTEDETTTKYRLFVWKDGAEKPIEPTIEIQETENTVKSYRVTGLERNTDYFVQIEAVDENDRIVSTSGKRFGRTYDKVQALILEWDEGAFLRYHDVKEVYSEPGEIRETYAFAENDFQIEGLDPEERTRRIRELTENRELNRRDQMQNTPAIRLDSYSDFEEQIFNQGVLPPISIISLSQEFYREMSPETDDIFRIIEKIYELYADNPPIIVISVGDDQASEGCSRAEYEYARDWTPGQPRPSGDCNMIAAEIMEEERYANIRENMIIVGAVTYGGRREPGEILQDRTINTYYHFNIDTLSSEGARRNIVGTCFSNIYIGRMIAEIKSRAPELSNKEIIDLIFDTARDYQLESYFPYYASQLRETPGDLEGPDRYAGRGSFAQRRAFSTLNSYLETRLEEFDPGAF